MNRQTVKRLMTKGIMTYVAVFALVLMVAMPAMALVANSVGTREIQNHSIRSRDLRNEAVTTDRIHPRAVKRGKIGRRAIRTEHIQSINGSKIRYSKKTKYRSMAAGAFQPFYPEFAFVQIGLGGPDPGGIWVAEVDLPDGAKIKSVKLVCLDNSATVDVTATVARHNFDSDSHADMATVKTSGMGGATTFQNITDNSINFPTINNRDFAYFAIVYRIRDINDLSLIFGRILITYEVKGP